MICLLFAVKTVLLVSGGYLVTPGNQSDGNSSPCRYLDPIVDGIWSMVSKYRPFAFSNFNWQLRYETFFFANILFTSNDRKHVIFCYKTFMLFEI